MSGKIVIVTGANSGIGYETALGIAGKGAHVIMVCRDTTKGSEAMEKMKRLLPSASVSLLPADFSSFSSVRAFAETFLSTYGRLDVLVNNAGGIFGKRKVTPDKNEWTFQVNHLSPFLLTNLLLPLLKKSAPSRIVTVSSKAHYHGHISFEDIQAEKNFSPMSAYCKSKLCNVLFTCELARRLEGTGVTATCLHPGVIGTNFGNEGGSIVKYFYKTFGSLMTTTEKGAKLTIYLSTSPEVEGVSGKYFSNMKEKIPSKEANDKAVAKKLWDISAELTGLPG